MGAPKEVGIDHRGLEWRPMPRTAALILVILIGCSTVLPPTDGLDELSATSNLRNRPDWEGIDAALAEVHAGIRANPDWAEGWVQRGNILSAHGFWENALESYDRALAIRPKLLDALTARGLLREIHARSVDAERDFNAVIEAAPGAPDGYLLRGWLERRNGRYSESERDLAEARTRGPGRWEDYHNAGAAAVRAQHWAVAERNFELALLLRPDHADGWIALSRIHAARGQQEKAIEDLVRADLERPGDAAIWYARAELLRSLGRWEEAIRAYDCAISLGSQPIMYAGRGQARAATQDSGKAESDLDYALELEPGLREAWVARARLRAGSGRFEEARADFAAALRIRASASVLHDLARLHHDREHWGPAVEGYEAALRICDDAGLRKRIERELGQAKARQK
jgi:tetratricopeptide (TPR) repeat protein